ncbi:Uncharacterised protein [Serratia quinivorans]|nr:Uncharacterised protein [Serratia quinivorans]CAI2143377.1 Uncharacterised protein [Serratia quinivorans]
MVRLLFFLLSRRDEEEIKIDELLFHVWDKYDLQSSSQRVWQVMQALKFRLKIMGVPDDFITRTDNKSYKIRGDLVTPIYF